MTRRRVVVTGMGIVSPVGIGLVAAWDSIRNARSGVAAITRFDCSTFPTRIAAEVKNFDVYNRNFQEFQSNLKAASETAISVTDNIVKTGGKAAVELNKMKDSSVQLLTEELKSNDFI